MSNAKIEAIVDQALKREAYERLADRDAMLETLDNEIEDLRGAIGIMLNRVETMEVMFGQLVKRVEILETGVPEANA